MWGFLPSGRPVGAGRPRREGLGSPAGAVEAEGGEVRGTGAGLDGQESGWRSWEASEEREEGAVSGRVSLGEEGKELRCRNLFLWRYRFSSGLPRSGKVTLRQARRREDEAGQPPPPQVLKTALTLVFILSCKLVHKQPT